MRSLDQIRAARAFEAVAALQGRESLDRAATLPMMLLQNGLLASWAFLLNKAQKGGVAEGRLLAIFCDHFRGLSHLASAVPDGPPDDVFRRWVGDLGRETLTGPQLRDLSAEAVALAGWLKRAAEARVPEPDEEAGDA